MFSNKAIFLLVATAFISTSLWAVTEQDVWVPKRYTVAKHKLLSTAVEAERTERCVSAIQGSLNLQKTTKQAYYFVVTCRDKNRHSYNLSYTYPIDGAMPTLVNEQLIVVEVVEEVVVAVPSISANEAWPLCVDTLRHKVRKMLDVQITELNPEPSDEGLPEQVLVILFEAKDPDGFLLRYQGNCVVDLEKNISMKISGRTATQ